MTGRILGRLTAAVALAFGSMLPGAGAVLADDPPLVAVTAIVEHPSLDAVRDGLRERLAELGHVDGETISFTFESAQGNPTIAAQIARRFAGEAPAVIVAISTPSAQAAAAAAGDIPVVFTAVTDPLAAGLVTDMAAPGGTVTGLSDMLPMDQQLDLILEIAPETAVIGVPHNPGEANAVVLVERLSALAEARGLAVEPAAAARTADVRNAAQSLVGEADILYVPTDNTVVSALESVLTVGRDNALPVFTGDTDSVARGSVASLGFDYFQVGRQTADVVAAILDGADPGGIPVTVAEGTDLVVNPAAAEAMGMALPEAVIGRATRVVE